MEVSPRAMAVWRALTKLSQSSVPPTQYAINNIAQVGRDSGVTEALNELEALGVVRRRQRQPPIIDVLQAPPKQESAGRAVLPQRIPGSSIAAPTKERLMGRR